MNLVERLGKIEPTSKESLIDILVSDLVRPKDVEFFSYHDENFIKKDLVKYILEYLNGKGSSFSTDMQAPECRAIYSGINKEPLKRVGYGIANAQSLTEDILSNLSIWEGAYLLAGIWHIKSSKDDRQTKHYEHRTVVELVCDVIREGIEFLENVHENVADYSRSRGEYVTKPQLPYAHSILEDIEHAKAEIINQEEEFSREITNDAHQARILKREMDSAPLFADMVRPQYEKLQKKIQQRVSTTRYADEFIQRHEIVYGKDCIREHLQ